MQLPPSLVILRPKQWIKNTFVWIAGFFAGNLFMNEVFLNNLIAFLVFCSVSSFIYVFNDYIDRHSDALHPTKNRRPLASGALKFREAIIIAFLLLLLTVIGLGYLQNEYVIIAILCYILLNVAYSLYLKKLPIIDLQLIALGFMIRVFVGGFVSGVPVSHWLILLTYLLALVLGLGKRRGELKHISSSEGRIALKGYNLAFIDLSLVLILGVTIVCYIMYALTPTVIEHFGTPYFYLSCIPVIIGLMRYLQLALVYEKTESPTQLLYEDHFLQMTLMTWLLIIGGLLYV